MHDFENISSKGYAHLSEALLLDIVIAASAIS